MGYQEDLGMVIISMMVLCNVTIEHRALSMEYDRRSSGLSSAPLDMEYDNSQQYRVIAIAQTYGCRAIYTQYE